MLRIATNFRARALIFLTIALAITNCAAITSFDIRVDDESIDTIYIGQPFDFYVDGIIGEKVGIFFVPDTDGDGIWDSTETSILDATAKLTDNEVPDGAGSVLLEGDLNPLLGAMQFRFLLSLYAGTWFIGVSDDATFFYKTLVFRYVSSDIPYISGTTVFEGTPTEGFRDIRGYFLALIGDLEHNWLLLPIDTIGNFTCAIPFAPCSCTVIFFPFNDGPDSPLYDMGYYLSFFRKQFFLDTSLEACTLFVPRNGIFPGTFETNIYDPNGLPLTCDSLLVVTRHTDEEIISTRFCNITGGHSFDTIEVSPASETYFRYFKLPARMMGKSTEQLNYPLQNGRIFFRNGALNNNLLFTDTLVRTTGNFWLKFDYDPISPAVTETLPVFVTSNSYVSRVLLPRNEYVIIDARFDTIVSNYSIAIDNISALLPPEYDFRSPKYGILQNDTVNLLVGRQNVELAGTLFTNAGERIIADGYIEICEYEPYEYFGCYAVKITDGAFTRRLFDYTNYKFKFLRINQNVESEFFDNYIVTESTFASFPTGPHSKNFIFYPNDSCFWLYIENSSPEYIDSTYYVIIRNTDHEIFSKHRVIPNTWQRVPISSALSSTCKLTVGFNCLPSQQEMPFTRYIAHNGSIMANAGDSIRIVAQNPVAYCNVNLVEDPEDSWQYELYASDLYFNYYSYIDTSLMYTYTTSASFYPRIPIFSERMIVRAEAKDPGVWDLHHFIANQNVGYILGGPYRPANIEFYLNKGSGEVLLLFDGYPYAEIYDTAITLSMSCIQLPDFPTNRYNIRSTALFSRGYGSVMGFHDLCDGEWTISWPETLPGGYVCAFSDTTFYVPNIDRYPDWNEFRVRIPVKLPNSIHGSIYKNIFSSPNIEPESLEIVIMSALTGDTVKTARAWQFDAWNAARSLYSIDVTYFPAGDYIAKLTLTNYCEPLFIYPDSICFHFTGADFELPAFYVDFAGAMASVIFTDLPDSERDGALLTLSLTTDSSYPGLVFFDIEPTFPLRASTEPMEIVTPRGAWTLTPHLNLGRHCLPTDTTLETAFWLPSVDFSVTFYCTTSSDIWDIYGALTNDLSDPEPVELYEFTAQLLSPDRTTVLYETPVTDDGRFTLRDIPAGFANFSINNVYRNVFIFARLTEFYLERDTDIGTVFVDNVSGYVTIAFEGFERIQLPMYIELLSSDAIVTNFAVDWSGDFQQNIWLPDGTWEIIPHFATTTLSFPSETTLYVPESSADYTVVFRNFAKIASTIANPERFDISCFPNPFNAKLTILFASSAHLDDVSVSIYDLTGKLVFQQNITPVKDHGHSMNWQPLPTNPAGIYLVKITSRQYNLTQKILYVK